MNDAVANERRMVGDPIADEVIARFLEGEPEERRQAELGRVIRLLRAEGDSRPAWISEWVGQYEPLPNWASPRLIASGQRFFNDFSLDITVILFCASLPYAYAVAQGAEVLARASQLAKEGTAARRIAETGEMLLDVTSPGAFGIDGRGYRRLREIRLLHAAVRAMLTQPPNLESREDRPWSFNEYGCPVNQEDMFGTLLTFTAAIFRSMSRIGVTASRSEKEAYLHLWKVVGSCLGVSYSYPLDNPDEAEALADSLLGRLARPSAAGHRLMNILLEEMEMSVPAGMYRLPRTMVRFLIGDRYAELLGVPAAAWWSPLLPAVSTLDSALSKLPGGPALMKLPSRLIGRSFIRMRIDRSITGEADAPRIDLDILRKWRIRTRPDRQSLGIRGRLRQRRRRIRKAQGKANNGC